MAPDDTSTTSAPRAWVAARASTSGPICPALAPLIDDDPTFTTMRRACVTAVRSSDVVVVIVILPPHPGSAFGLELRACGGLGVHPLEVRVAALTASGPQVLVEPGVRAPRAGDQLRRRAERGLPVEDHLADHDRGSRHGPVGEQRVLDAQLREPVGEESDRLVVG